MTKCLIKYLIPVSISYDLLNDDVVVILFSHLSSIYKELLKPSLINRVLILKYQFNSYKPRPSTASSLIPKPLFPLISIILIIDNYL
jgi:hypothetical protein